MQRTKRVGALILNEAGTAMQSLGFSEVTKIGELSRAIRYLSEQKIDELTMLTIGGGLQPDYAAVEVMLENSMGSPLSYGGGVSSIGDVTTLLEIGVDRVIVSAKMISDKNKIYSMLSAHGLETFLLHLPIDSGSDEKGNKNLKFTREQTAILNLLVSEDWKVELLITDKRSSGYGCRHDIEFWSAAAKIFRDWPAASGYGGLFSLLNSSTVGRAQDTLDWLHGLFFGTSLLHSKLRIDKIRRILGSSCMRPSDLIPGKESLYGGM